MLNQDQQAEVAEWQTRRTQNPVLATGCGFKSHLRYSVVRILRFAGHSIDNPRELVGDSALFSESIRPARVATEELIESLLMTGSVIVAASAAVLIPRADVTAFVAKEVILFA
jgi:hypothetical protein